MLIIVIIVLNILIPLIVAGFYANYMLTHKPDALSPRWASFFRILATILPFALLLLVIVLSVSLLFLLFFL